MYPTFKCKERVKGVDCPFGIDCPPARRPVEEPPPPTADGAASLAAPRSASDASGGALVGGAT